MKLRNRFLLVGTGIVIFVIMTPILVLYALGYKIDYQTKQIQKTGSFVIKSEPAKAQIHLDDQQLKNRTNTTVRFLLPGDYTVKISKDGYQSWTKRLNVRSGIVTWANPGREFITLFLNEPKSVSSHGLEFARASQMENLGLVVQNGKPLLLDPNQKKLEPLEQSVEVFDPPINFTTNENAYYLLRYPQTANLGGEIITKASTLQSNGSYSAALVDKDLFSAKGNGPSKIASGVSGFYLEKDHLWFIEGTVLKHLNLSLGVSENIITLPYQPESSQIIRGDSRIFLVLDQSLFALNDSVEEIYRGVTEAYWDDEMQKLVFASKNEVLLFEPRSFQSELIIRSSSPMLGPRTNGQTGYLFFMNENKIKAIELDGRDHRNVYTITDKPAKSFLISDDGKLLTLFNETGVEQLEIR